MRAFRSIVAVAAVLVLAGCTGAPPQASRQPYASAGDGNGGVTGELTVYAAASLAGPFTTLLDEFASRYPQLAVRPATFDGSSTLATQLSEGAPADVFASADEATMRRVSSEVETPVVFANNTLRIAVARGNPRGIHSLADLAKPGLTVVLCAPQVPCGAASRALLDLAGVRVTPASEEQNVTAVLNKVSLGEADAGLVYLTDVAAANGVIDGVVPENADRVVNEYPIAVVSASRNRAAARAFVAFVRSAEGQTVLERFGFGSP